MGIGYGVNGMLEMLYEVVPANAFAMFDERSMVLPAQTEVLPAGLMVKLGFCAFKAKFDKSKRIKSK